MALRIIIFADAGGHSVSSSSTVYTDARDGTGTAVKTLFDGATGVFGHRRTPSNLFTFSQTFLSFDCSSLGATFSGRVVTRALAPTGGLYPASFYHGPYNWTSTSTDSFRDYAELSVYVSTSLDYYSTRAFTNGWYQVSSSYWPGAGPLKVVLWAVRNHQSSESSVGFEGQEEVYTALPGYAGTSDDPFLESTLASGNEQTFTDTTQVVSWTVPASSAPYLQIEGWGGGGGGGTPTGTTNVVGGGGGEYRMLRSHVVTPGETLYIRVGAGGAAGNNGVDSWVSRNSNGTSPILLIKGGQAGGQTANSGGYGGGDPAGTQTGGIGEAPQIGGRGGSTYIGTSYSSNGGGSAAGRFGPGQAGMSYGYSGGPAGTGGYVSYGGGGGAGGNGAASSASSAAQVGFAPGGGGGSASGYTGSTSATGGRGEIIINWATDATLSAAKDLSDSYTVYSSVSLDHINSYLINVPSLNAKVYWVELDVGAGDGTVTSDYTDSYSIFSYVTRPASDIVDGAWLPSQVSAPLYSMIDELVVSEADFIYVETANSVAEVGLQSVADPGPGSGHTVWIHASGVSGETLRVKLFEGTTEIASWDQILTPTPTTYGLNLTPVEIASITNRADLRLKFEGL